MQNARSRVDTCWGGRVEFAPFRVLEIDSVSSDENFLVLKMLDDLFGRILVNHLDKGKVPSFQEKRLDKVVAIWEDRPYFLFNTFRRNIDHNQDFGGLLGCRVLDWLMHWLLDCFLMPCLLRHYWLLRHHWHHWLLRLSLFHLGVNSF
eukprot:Lithocolla_globosa_v1_NODE_43_length_8091_cov_73.466584.p3 type:complete len:148 gc:universal NODE_43_length_8091_cov_73.466584:1318-1761(+)